MIEYIFKHFWKSLIVAIIFLFIIRVGRYFQVCAQRYDIFKLCTHLTQYSYVHYISTFWEKKKFLSLFYRFLLNIIFFF